MSIVDSREERVAAEQKLADQPIERIRLDLEFWSLAAHDTVDQVRDAYVALERAKSRHHEAREWVGLLVDELRRRRDVPRGTVSEASA